MATGELYLSLAYFYFKKFQLKNLYGPNQFLLIGLQFVGIVFIGANYCINNFVASNLSYLFYKEHEQFCSFMYYFTEILSMILFFLTLIIILSRRKKIQIYNVINESKN